MKITVIGSTGGVGRKLVELGLARGHEVCALARTPSALAIEHDKLRVVPGDALDPTVMKSAVEGSEVVLSALGTMDRSSTVRSQGTKNALEAAKAAGVKRFACVSAIGVGDSRAQAQKSNFVFGRIIMPLLLTRTFEDMARMEDDVRESGLAWTIVRPTGLNNKPAAHSVKAVLDLSKVGSSIAREDVAAFMLDAVEKGQYLEQSVSIYG